MPIARLTENRYWIAGTVAVAAIAAVVSVFLRNDPWSSLIPLLFIAVIVLCARVFGLVAGLVSSLITAVLFSVLLLQPTRRHHIPPHAQANLALMLFAGVALSYSVSKKREPETASRDGKGMRRASIARHRCL